MSEQLAYARVRMLISSMFEGLASGSKLNEISFEISLARKMIRYSREFEIRNMGSGVILIKEPNVELLTDEDLADMGFGC